MRSEIQQNSARSRGVYMPTHDRSTYFGVAGELYTINERGLFEKIRSLRAKLPVPAVTQ